MHNNDGIICFFIIFFFACCLFFRDQPRWSWSCLDSLPQCMARCTTVPLVTITIISSCIVIIIIIIEECHHNRPINSSTAGLE